MKYSTKILDIQGIGITIASGKEIRSWAERKLPNGKIVGEVSSADTVRLKNLKPIKDGLFCERIFGPVKDFVCSCGKYHKIKREKQKEELSYSYSYYCRQCEVPITVSKERRYRLGYIRLHSLVTHVWFFKDKSSNPLPEWVEIDKKLLELISYCAVEFLQYNYPQTTFAKKWYSNPDPQNSNLGRRHINFSNYFLIQSSWLKFFEVRSDFIWFAKRYAQKKKNLLNSLEWKKLGVKKENFLKIEKKSISSSKSNFLKYNRSNVFLFTPETQNIYHSSTSKKMLFKKDSKLTKQKTFLLKIKKISLLPILFSLERPFFLVFLFHFLKKFFFFNEKFLSTCVNKKKKPVFTLSEKLVVFLTELKKTKQSQYFTKDAFLSTPFLKKKIIIGNCFQKKNQKKQFQEKNFFFASKLDQYPFHNYTHSVTSSNCHKNTSLWKKFCISLVLGERKGCWIFKTKKKSCIYKFFIPQINLLKKKKFLFYQKKHFFKKKNFTQQTLKVEPIFVFSSKLKKNVLQKKKSKFLKQYKNFFETRKVRPIFYNIFQNKSLIYRFVKSNQQSKFYFSKKKSFFLFTNRQQTFNLKNSLSFNGFQSLFKSKLFFNLITFQKVQSHYFKKLEKKLWWWFFLKQKKKNIFQNQYQYCNNSLLDLYSWNEKFFFYQKILFDKKKISSVIPNFLYSRSVFNISRIVLNSLKKINEQRYKKKNSINQKKFFNEKKKSFKKITHNFIIKKKKSNFDNEKIKTKSYLFLLSNFFYHRRDRSSFQLKDKIKNRLTYTSCKNLQKKKQILQKVKKNKNFYIKSIFYYENIVKKQVFQLAFSLFANFSILYSFFALDIDKIFFFNPIQNQPVLNSSFFFLNKNQKKIKVTVKKKLNKKNFQNILVLSTNWEHHKKNVREVSFSNSLKQDFEFFKNKFTHSRQRTNQFLPKKKTIKVFGNDIQTKTNWILSKTNVFSLQIFSFSSKLFLKLCNKKNFHTNNTNKLDKKKKFFSIFLFFKKFFFWKISLNLKQLLGFKKLKNYLNFEDVLKTIPHISQNIYPQKHFLIQILSSDITFLPIRSGLKLVKYILPFPNLQVFHVGTTKSIKKFKLTFLHTNFLTMSKTSSYCFSTLKTIPSKLRSNTSTSPSYLFFFYLNVFLILLKNRIFGKVLPLSDAFISTPFRLKKKNLFVGCYWRKYLQQKDKNLQTKNKKNTNLLIHHKFFFFSGTLKPIIFWFFETIKSSFFLMSFIEIFVNSTQTTFSTPNHFGLKKTGPQAVFHLLSRSAPFKGHVSSSTFIDLNTCRKQLVPFPSLLKKAPFLFRRYRLKCKRILSKYRQANRMLKILEEYPNVGEKKRGPHILSHMFLSVIPVLPPTLRPIIPLPGNVTAISDLNRLYQRILYRNNRFLKTPEPYYAHRILQEAVDALIENGKGGSKPVSDQKNRPYKSLSDILKGKQGRFRQNLLGKRVDYSGRSVIVVGPQLHIHECGLPKQMAIELFQPFLLRALKNFRVVNNIFEAKKIIEKEDPIVWKILHQILPSYPILLNRAPTLHRLGIQAFQPKLVSGQALLLHPLVCTAFNADFDGDQMAIHIPLSIEARSEAWNLMWSRHHLFSAATGQPIIVPSQDMVLGVYFLTTNPFQYLAGSGVLFNTFHEVVEAYENHRVHLQTSVWVKTKIVIETNFDLEQPLEIRLTFSGDCIQRFVSVQSHYNEKSSLFKRYVCTTPGRILMNQLIALN